MITSPSTTAKSASRLRDAAALARREAEGWQPLPHQVPPSGNWYGWLLMAGRFAGKTDACAHAMVEHVNGPPCMPGPIPHWMAIIGPTLGDAVRACYEGPSGLRAHDPRAVLVNRAGGTVVHWPNGSEAKIFGAHTEEDTDRLRAGGNNCLAEGTLIRTERGQVPIEKIVLGDQVWTRNGLRRVIKVWDNGVKKTREYRYGSRSVVMTDDHEVWTDDGWKRADSVTTDDTVFVWGNTESRSSTTASCGTFAKTVTTCRSIAGCCTGTCTHRKSALSLPECTCITRIMSSRTTGQTTSYCFDRGSTGPSTGKSEGTTGTARVARQQLPTGSGRRSYASSAEKSSAPWDHSESSSTAPGSAGTKVLRHGHHKNGCAACAEAGSSPLDGAWPVRVHGSALRSTLLTSNEHVYDLTVEHDHEFFANDLLVSNCFAWGDEVAAWRYLDAAYAQMRFGLRIGPRPRWIGSTTPRPRPLIKKLAEGRVRNTVVTHATSRENPYIIGEVLENLLETYEGTSLGAQEIEGRIVDQDENALWTREAIEAARILPGDLPQMTNITVGVDPSGGVGEQGIVVAGKALWTPPGSEGGRILHHGFVLDDWTCHMKPEGWGKRAVNAAVEWDADDIVVEQNYGRDMAISTIRSAAELLGVTIPIRVTNATRGKKVRAEPVSALTAQGRWHHAGVFPDLEDQLTTWHEDLDWSPDRLDAMVWDAWHLKLAHTGPSGTGSIGSRAANRQIVPGRR